MKWPPVGGIASYSVPRIAQAGRNEANISYSQNQAGPSEPMHILATSTAFPPHYYTQREVVDALLAFWGADRKIGAVLERLHLRTGVDGRYFSRPLDQYATRGARSTTCGFKWLRNWASAPLTAP
jgi:hypothetical protein